MCPRSFLHYSLPMQTRWNETLLLAGACDGAHSTGMLFDAHTGAWRRQKVGDLLGEKALEEMLRLSSRDPRIIVR